MDEKDLETNKDQNDLKTNEDQKDLDTNEDQKDLETNEDQKDLETNEDQNNNILDENKDIVKEESILKTSDDLETNKHVQSEYKDEEVMEKNSITNPDNPIVDNQQINSEEINLPQEPFPPKILPEDEYNDDNSETMNIIDTDLFEVLLIEEEFELKQFDMDFLNDYLTKYTSINPIVNSMFNKIINKCLNGFDFISNKISFEEYLEFFREVNRLVPTLEKKIVYNDCEGSMFFVGDSHGSIEDSFYVIDFFMKILKEKPKEKMVYVGDYVDRNPHDLQNLTLIIAFSLLFRNNVILLRGNHEDRVINDYYGFKDNLLRKFYDQAEELHDEILKYFIHLPLAHVGQMMVPSGEVKARIFSVHGGIPIDPMNFMDPILLDGIEEKLKCEVEKSDDMDVLSISMLWSDPDELIQYIVTDDGNSGRMQFGFNVLDAFLKVNKLDVVVRGHQKWNAGYRIFFNYKLFSLFSTSKYDDRKKFDPKILQLELGKAPNIIPIDPEELQKIAKNYLNQE